MSGTRAAIRYAKAMLQNVEDASKAKTIFEDMQDIYTTLTNSKELRNVLKSPVIKTEDKQEALLKIFSNQSVDSKALLRVLVNNQRTAILGDVAANYMKLYNEAQGVKVATVTTAIPLSESLEKQVLAKVEALTGSKKITLQNEVDESIIGGFILRIGDLQYNASISNQLSNLKREFSKSL
ncbi:MAG: ATP synthase F1 subunit delta [Flavobacteriaceae bacterium]